MSLCSGDFCIQSLPLLSSSFSPCGLLIHATQQVHLSMVPQPSHSTAAVDPVGRKYINLWASMSSFILYCLVY